MAMKTIVMLLDDLDGGEADRTVTFELDGTGYEIELNEANIERLTKTLQPYIDKARKPQPRKPQRDEVGGGTAQVRVWAREQGIPISDRGRVPAETLDAYRRRSRA